MIARFKISGPSFEDLSAVFSVTDNILRELLEQVPNYPQGCSDSVEIKVYPPPDSSSAKYFKLKLVSPEPKYKPGVIGYTHEIKVEGAGLETVSRMIATCLSMVLTSLEAGKMKLRHDQREIRLEHWPGHQGHMHVVVRRLT
jgi:hypothetical protein